MSATYAVAWGSTVGRFTPIASIASYQTRLALDRDLLGRAALAVGAVDDVVVDVGDVRDVANLEPRPLEVATQHVEHEREPAVAEVGRAVDRGTTHVHAHLARLAERELADSAGGGVVEADHGLITTGNGSGRPGGHPVAFLHHECSREAHARRTRRALDRGLGARRHLPLRPHEDPRRDLLDRHPAADGQRRAAPGPRLLLQPDRHGRPLPAHARARGLLPDGLGRQRPERRAPRPAHLRRHVRPVAPLRPGVRRARDAAEAADPDLAAQLRRAVRRAHRAARAGVLRALDPGRASRSTGARPTRRSARRLGARRSAASSQLLRDGHAYLAEAPTLWDVDFKTAVAQAELEDRERPGAYHRIGFRRDRRRRARLHRDHPSRAPRRVRRARRPSRRRALPAALRHAPCARRCSTSRSRSSRTSSPIPRRGRASR